MHEYFIVTGIVDGQVAHKQAWDRLIDTRTGGEDSIVHYHSYKKECTSKCTRYHTCVTSQAPGSHSIAESCPERKVDSNA